MLHKEILHREDKGLWQLQNLVAALEQAPDLPPREQESWQTSDFSIDSRQLKAKDTFFAMQGEKRDGHLFIPAAIAAGAAGIIAQKGYLQKCDPEIQLLLRKNGIALFEVKDTLKALHALASYHRRRLQAIIIAVTGSNGKSSSKEMLGSLIGAVYGRENVFVSPGNLNNQLGLPLSILQIKPHHRFAVLEMGMNHAGEIAQLSRLARPHHALITSIGRAHTEFFKNIEEIASAKLEILQGMASGGCLVCNTKNLAEKLIRQMADRAQVKLLLFGNNQKIDGQETDRIETDRIKTDKIETGRVESSSSGLRFVWQGEPIYLPHIHNEIQASNLNGCLCLLEALGFNKKRLVRDAADLSLSIKGRFEIIKKERPQKRVQLLVDDSYNANPDSFCVAIKSLRKLLPSGCLALVAGEMAELGTFSEAGHEIVGQSAADEGYKLLAACGGKYAQIAGQAFRDRNPQGRLIEAEEPKELFDILIEKEELSCFDGILVKGSRSAQMEILSDLIKEQVY